MRAANVLNLGIKEFRSLGRDPMMLVLIVFAFTVAVYASSTAIPETLHKAPIAVVDEDQSPLSTRIAVAFYPPYFVPRQRSPLRRWMPGWMKASTLLPSTSHQSSSATCSLARRRPSSSMLMPPA
jgi:hypothetical protein